MRLSIFLKILFVLLMISSSFADNTVGLIQNDDTQSYTGYTLFAPNTTTTTYLIDIDGNLVHQWESDYLPGLSVYLLEDGSLLRTAKIEDPAGVQTTTGGFQKLDWDGNIIWEYYQGTQHHDIEPMPNSNVLMVVNDRQAKNAAIQAGRNPDLIAQNAIRALSLIEVSQTGPTTGDVVWQWNSWDHLIQDFDQTKDNYGTVADHPELIDVNFARNGEPDWLHTNSVAYNKDLDQIVVSNRGTNEIWIIDHSTTTEQAATHEGGNGGKGGDLLYRWGNPVAYRVGDVNDQKLFGQHDAHWIDTGLTGDGNILIYNNGIDRPEGAYSTVVEITPPAGYPITVGSAFDPVDPTWIYPAVLTEDFYSARYGGAQRLPNDNTLICNSDSGEFIELNSNSDIVWKYVNPVTSDGIVNQGTTDFENNDVFRCYRYADTYSGFDGKDLTAGDPIETYNVSVDNETSQILSFRLEQNHPNPFNPSTNIEFQLEKSSVVTLIIYDIIGNEITTLINEHREPGVHSIGWDSYDSNGNPVSSGVYFYKIMIGQESQTMKMMLMK